MNINAGNNALSTSLYIAAQAGHVEIVEMLLAAKADIHSRDDKGMTPLHGAASNGRAQTLEYLISSGADIGAVSKQGATPLYLAAKNGHTEVIRALIAAGANENMPDARGCFPLHAAVRSGHIASVRLLLEAGADRDALAPILEIDHTPLSLAEAMGHKDIADLLKQSLGVQPSNQSIAVEKKASSSTTGVTPFSIFTSTAPDGQSPAGPGTRR